VVLSLEESPLALLMPRMTVRAGALCLTKTFVILEHPSVHFTSLDIPGDIFLLQYRPNKYRITWVREPTVNTIVGPTSARMTGAYSPINPVGRTSLQIIYFLFNKKRGCG
jgi:hypothetical protein